MSDCSVVYKDTPIKIQEKMLHLHAKTWRLGKNKRKKLLRNSFCENSGDVPIAVLCTENVIFGSVKVYAVVNHRGNAYALRNAKCFKKSRKNIQDKIKVEE